MMSGVILLASIFLCCEGSEIVSINTTGDGSFTNIMERGIVVSGTTSILFSVQACAEAVIVLSNIVSMSNTRGRYFLIVLGKASNTKVSVTDSCFRCPKTKESETKLLQCNRFVDVWCRWNGKGHIEIGKGKQLGEGKILDMQSNKTDDYPVYSIAVTSTNDIKGFWKFIREPLDTHLLQPGPHGWSLVEMSDLSPPGSDVMDILLTPRDRSANYYLSGESVELFSLTNNTIILARSLNLSQPFHLLHISSDIGFNTTLTVTVTQGRPRLHNYNLDVYVNDVITIPEGLPPGSVIDWNLSVSDTDRNDISTFAINGSMASFFTVLKDGELQLQKLLDRDAKSDKILGGELTLIVSDFKPNIRRVNISVRIQDINDNPPVFDRDIYVVSVQEHSPSDVELLALKCSDADEGPNGQVTMSIFKDSSKSESFYLKGTRLYVRTRSLDYEGSESHMETIIIHAVDTPDSGNAMTGSVAILVKILPMDEFDPVWVSPKPDQTGRFPDLEVLEASPAGVLVGIFKIRDDDEGDGSIAYTLETVSPSDNNGNVFSLNSETGEMRTSVSLDQRGQPDEYDITVTASSGEKTIKADIKVRLVSHIEPVMISTMQPQTTLTHAPQTEHKIPSQSRNLPVFDKVVYVIEKSAVSDWRKTLLNIQVTIPGSPIPPSVVLDDNGRTNFRLRNLRNSWKLFADKHVETGNLPSVIVLKAFQPSDPTAVSIAHVLINDHVTECSMSTSFPSVHFTAKEPDGPTDPPVLLHVETQEMYKSECHPPDETSERVLILITIAEAAGLLSVLIFHKRLARGARTRRKKQKLGKRPIRQEPIGREKAAERREPKRKRSTQNKDAHTNEKLNKPCFMTLAEVESGDAVEEQATSLRGKQRPRFSNGSGNTGAGNMSSCEKKSNGNHSDGECTKRPQHPEVHSGRRLSQTSDIMKESLHISHVDKSVNASRTNIDEDEDQMTDNLINELELELGHSDDDSDRSEGKNASRLEDMNVCDESVPDDHKSRLNPDGCPSEENVRNYSFLEESDTEKTKSASKKNRRGDKTDI